MNRLLSVWSCLIIPKKEKRKLKFCLLTLLGTIGGFPLRDIDNYMLSHGFNGVITKEMKDRFLRMMCGVTEMAKNLRQSQSQDQAPSLEGADQSQ